MNSNHARSFARRQAVRDEPPHGLDESLRTALIRPTALVEMHLERNAVLDGELDEDGEVPVEADLGMLRTRIALGEANEEVGLWREIADEADTRLALLTRVALEAEDGVHADLDIDLLRVLFLQ